MVAESREASLNICHSYRRERMGLTTICCGGFGFGRLAVADSLLAVVNLGEFYDGCSSRGFGRGDGWVWSFVQGILRDLLTAQHLDLGEFLSTNRDRMNPSIMLHLIHRYIG